MPELASAVAAQHAAAVRLTSAVEDAYKREGKRVRGRLDHGAVLAGDALTRWRGYPLDTSADELLDSLAESLAALLQCAVAAADERIADAWRREPAAGAVSLPAPDREAGERIGVAVRRWRRVLEELAEEEVARSDRQPAPDPDGIAALLVAALLGGKRARPAGRSSPNGSARRPPCGCATGAGNWSATTSTRCCAPNATAGSPRWRRSK